MSALSAPKTFYIKQKKAQAECVSSLFFNSQLVTNIAPETKFNLVNYVKTTFTALTNLNFDFKQTWLSLSTVSFIAIATVFIVYPVKSRPQINNAYSIYASKPQTLEENTTEIQTKDSRAQKINNVFRDYKCPLEGLGETFVQEADKNNIPWWIVASIAFQESTCGKRVPIIDGQNSYNAWGYAVYGGNVHMFDNWVRGVETVSKYLGKRFFSKGITDPNEIMATYTPPSQGSWSKGVTYFADIIKNYSSSEN